ncbi:MAG: hypothetical protein ACD_84C00040G0002 [uncultured bacterium]|nr:MAG: hypothetical protein ACD_84C00040G0002 [uncultured bacterium]
MKLLMNEFGIHGSPTEVLLDHAGEQLAFNIALFDKMSFSGGFDIFEEINGYWSRLPVTEQDKIFIIYKKIKDVFDSVWDMSELTRQLYVLVKELYDHHELTDIRHWMDFHSNLVLPDGLRDSFLTSQETSSTRERTYLKDDYKWLVTMTIALRAMIPIWGEFIARTRKETGTVFKEYYAFQLLAYSNIAKSEPMERLRVYVEHSMATDKSMSAAILGGISSEDFPTWVLGLVVVRRLTVGDVRGVETNSSLVTFIYKFIGQKVKGHDNSFIGLVKEKVVEGQGQEGENNLSKLEGYKIKQEFPAGDIAIIGFYLQNPLNIAKMICPEIDPELVLQSIVNVQSLDVEQIWKPQTVLMQWVLSSVIPPRGLLHISKALSLNAMGVTSALLWHRGHYELAGLLSATEQLNQEELLLGGTDSRARITREQMEQLDVLYPFSRKPVGKQKVIKRLNPAAEAIDSVASMFSGHDWKLTLPSEMIEKITGNPNNRRYATPYDIKIKLAKLAIELASRTF